MAFNNGVEFEEGNKYTSLLYKNMMSDSLQSINNWFKLDLEGLNQLSKSTNLSTDDLFEILPDDMIDAIFEDISNDLQNNNKVSDVHDACFEVQLLAEQYPEHAGYIETRVLSLTKQLIVFINNVKKVDK